MTDRKLPELFAERPVRSDFAHASVRRRGVPYAVRRIVTVIVLLAVIGGGLYWKFGHTSQSMPGEIPMIKSEGPYKQRPDQPGGLEIPNQDVQVYQEISNNPPPKPQVEHLLPPPEVPTAPPAQAAFAPPTPQQLESLTPEKKNLTTATQAETMRAPPSPATAPVSAPTTTVEATSLAPPEAQPVPEVSPQATVKKPAAVAATTAPKTIADVLKDVAQPPSAYGNSAVQLAAVQDQATAQALTDKLKAKYASILGNTRLHIVKADLGAKGIYYRIQSLAMTEDRAKKMCVALKNAKAGCILVHP